MSTKKLNATYAKLIAYAIIYIDSILIKLADRLHNMRTIQSMPPDKRKEKALETLLVYAPLANLFGLREFWRELVDLAFREAYPQEHQEISRWLADKRAECEEKVHGIGRSLQTWIDSEGIHAEVNIHPKQPFSYMGQEKDMRDPCVLRLRIISDSESELNALFGAICLWPEGRLIYLFNYVIQPKINGYRSIHATLMVDDYPVRIQLRTFEMHQIAERGVAAFDRSGQHINMDSELQNQYARARILLEWYRRLP